MICQGADGLQVHDFDRAVKPLLQRYCYGCHNATENKGEINLAAFVTADALAADAERLEGMLEAVGEGFMPPKKAKVQPTQGERKIIVQWLSERLHRIALEQAGDPGQVVIRRLTNAELNYTLADLTAVKPYVPDKPCEITIELSTVETAAPFMGLPISNSTAAHT